MKYNYHCRVFLAVLILLCFQVETLAQNGQNEITSFGTNIVPPSPDAAALGKYGNTPVGLHTGIPQISIPIYTIRSKSLEVPISLSYHASGIKVNEIASWAGLGWSLNAGGAISRSVVGLPDDNGGFWTQNVKNSTQITSADLDYVRGVANGQKDGESDYYFYNFNGNSGKFVYKQNSPQDPLIIPEVPIKITYTSENRFEITDEKGVLYKFAATETLTSTSGGVDQTFLSSFYLSEIISADGSDKILFIYEADGSYSETTASFSETIGPECTGVGAPQISNSHSKSNGSGTRTYNPQRLKEIIFSNGRVEFVKSGPRQDASTSRLSEIKVFDKKPDGSFSSVPIKSFALEAGYFESGTGTGELHYRLKLNALAEKDAQGKVVKNHSFFYNETTKLPHRTSLAQDWWGFYNGKTNNQSLIPTETFRYYNEDYTIGSGNREPNELAMQACILNKIVYPTGGYTELDYESHKYVGITKIKQDSSASSGELGNTTDLLQQTVSFTPATSGWATVKTSCSDVTDTDPFFSRVSLRRKSDSQILLNHVYDPYSYSFTDQPRLDKDFGVYLSKGVTYELQVMSKGNSSSTSLSGAAFSMATVYWDEEVSGVQKIAGGLRVKEIRDYEAPGKTPLKKIYKYGIGENENGYLLIPEYGINSSKQEIDIKFYTKGGDPQNVACAEVCQSTKLAIAGQPALELSSLNGAPVVYPEVTIYESSSTSLNGKQVVKFDVQEDNFIGGLHKSFSNGNFQLNDSWKGGDQIWSGIYEGNSSALVQESTSRYGIYKNTSATGTKIIPMFSFSGECTPTDPSTSDYYYFDYPIYSGIKKLTATSEIQYSSTDGSKSLLSHVNYEYQRLNNQHQQLTKQTTENSSGDILETKYWYPADYDPVNTIPALLQKNIIAIPIKTESHINGKIVSGIVKQLDSNGKPIEMYSYESVVPQTPPAHQTNTIVPQGYVKKIDIVYDPATKNVNNVRLSDNISSAYLWGYNNTYPIAEIKNAQNNYTTDTTGADPTTTTKSVSIPSGSFQDHTIPFDVGRSGTALVKMVFLAPPNSTHVQVNCLLLDPEGGSTSFILCETDCEGYPDNFTTPILRPGSYTLKARITSEQNLSKEGVSIKVDYPTYDYHTVGIGIKDVFFENFEENGTDGSAHTGKRFYLGDYSLSFPTTDPNRSYELAYWFRNNGIWELKVEPYLGPGKILSSGDAIDDVRVYPKDALMTTYTYDPLRGITSRTDPNNVTIFYEYDDFGRLQYIKDQERNILKKQEYYYGLKTAEGVSDN